MTWTAKRYGKSELSFWNKEIDLDTDTIVVIPSTVSYVPDQDAHDYVDDLSNELTTNNWARKTLASKTVGYTGATNKVKFDAADPAWTGLTGGNLRNLVVADTSPGADSSRPLIGYQLSDADVLGSGDLTFVFDASGLLETTIA